MSYSMVESKHAVCLCLIPYESHFLELINTSSVFLTQYPSICNWVCPSAQSNTVIVKHRNYYKHNINRTTK